MADAANCIPIASIPRIDELFEKYKGPHGLHINMTLYYANHDLFRYRGGCDFEGKRLSLGPCALELLAAIVEERQLTYDEIVAATGISKATVKAKAKALKALGIVTFKKVGRYQSVCYVKAWWEKTARSIRG